MKEKSPNPIQQESVQHKKGTMQKLTFGTKIGYVETIIVFWGLTLGLMYFAELTFRPGTSQLTEQVDCEKEGTDYRTLNRSLEIPIKTNKDYGDSSIINICLHVEVKKISSRQNAFYFLLAYVGNFITCHSIGVHDLLANPPKQATSMTLILSQIWKPSLLVLLAVDFVGMMLGYPDMTICTFLSLFAAVLLLGFLNIISVETMYQIVKKYEEQNFIMKKEAMELEQFSAGKTETV